MNLTHNESRVMNYNNFVLFMILFLLPVKLAAIEPDWAVDPGEFDFSANVRAELFVDDILIEDPQALLGAFVGDECRGVSHPVSFQNNWVFFLTVYSNMEGEVISFQTYVASEDVTIPVIETIEFSDGANYGSAFYPIPLHAVLYVDHPPEVSQIPGQEIEPSDDFTSFDLDDYLTEQDGQAVEWTASGQSLLIVQIDAENVVTIHPALPEVAISEWITFTATDQTPAGLFASSTALFTVLPVDHPPQVLDIPDQMAPFGEAFPPINLDDFLIEIDGDQVEWSYSFLPSITPNPDPDPGWEVDINNYEMAMTITAQVIANGELTQGGGHQLAAFSGGECRGLASPIPGLGSWFYFLTVYSNTNGEEITLKFYDVENGVQIPINETYQFLNGETNGSPVNPEILHAAFMTVLIDEMNVASIEIINLNWMGSVTIIFTATDINTGFGYSDSDYVTFSYSGLYDVPPMINPIPEQVIVEGGTFSPIDLDDYLLELDGDPVFWVVGGNTELLLDLNENNVLTVTAPYLDWFGEESIIIAVTDDTPSQLADVTMVMFSVLSINDDPFQVFDYTDLEIGVGASAEFIIDAFDDVEEGELTYTIQSGSETVATVALEGVIATVNGLSPGEAVLTVVAYDENGGFGSGDLLVTVVCQGIFDCNGDCDGTAFQDECGDCVGGNTGMTAGWAVDCNGACDGTANEDNCGICSGGDTGHVFNSDMDCNGDCFGTASFDACGLCAGGQTGLQPNIDDGTGFVTGPDADCNGDCFGTAYLDDCAECVNGNTGAQPDWAKDCIGDCFGTAMEDDCGICAGGDSGHAANSDIDPCNICPDGTFGIESDDPAPENYEYGQGPDCNGLCFGNAFINECGCVEGNTGIDELSCYGCTDPVALNYNSEASADDLSCLYIGDPSGDGIVNVGDIVLLVDIILFPIELTEELLLTSDLNHDGIISVVDLVMIVDLILGGSGARADFRSAMVSVKEHGVSLSDPTGIAGIHLQTTGSYLLNQTNLPSGWELHESPGNILIFSLDGSPLQEEMIFTYTGTLEITDGVLADWHGVGYLADIEVLPMKVTLNPAYPNPFNPVTALQYGLSEEVFVQMSVYDINGREVAVLANDWQQAGNYSVSWSADDMSSGIYFILLQAGGVTLSEKVILLK